METICLHCYVSGRVQGVWYRASAKKMAKRLGVNGWIRNTTDGRVETLICGTQTAVDEMLQWLWQGPIAAQVDKVDVESVQGEFFTDFEVR